MKHLDTYNSNSNRPVSGQIPSSILSENFNLTGQANPEYKKISRSEIEGISSLAVEGKETYLGELRNFKNHSYLEKFLPEDFSIGWVKLPSGQTLEPHFHPCASMIIVTKGLGRSLGDSEIPLKEGDIIHIPAWNLHGFQGLGEGGFEGLSIQFQETAIFESEKTPETTYIDREKIPLKDRELIKFSREDFDEINSVKIDGKQKNLGIVKNFRSNDLLNKILPPVFSAAWVHLKDKEVLSTHQHIEKSIILITNGSGRANNGISFEELKTGDGVFVPSFAPHGFEGTDKGFWGLSIQFSESSLYEDPSNPRVQFQSGFERLKKANEIKFRELVNLPIFDIPPEEFQKKPVAKKRLLDCLQTISRNFQTLMFSRVALANSSDYKKVFIEHLLDEIGHDTSLEEERGDSSELWDPILEASTSWFLAQNYVVDDPKRIIMVSMILEKCAGKFYTHFANILKDELSSEHIENHSDADPYHETLGVNLIERDCEYRAEEFIEFQNRAWDMLILYIRRKGELVSEVLR